MTKRQEWLNNNPLQLAIESEQVVQRRNHLAKRLGVSRQAMHAWLIGFSLPGTIALDAMYREFHVPPAAYVTWWKARPKERKKACR